MTAATTRRIRRRAKEWRAIKDNFYTGPKTWEECLDAGARVGLDADETKARVLKNIQDARKDLNSAIASRRREGKNMRPYWTPRVLKSMATERVARQIIDGINA